MTVAATGEKEPSVCNPDSDLEKVAIVLSRGALCVVLLSACWCSRLKVCKSHADDSLAALKKRTLLKNYAF